MLMVEFLISFWLAMPDAFITYSGVCFLERNGGSTSCAQWQCAPKKRHLHYEGLGRLSNFCNYDFLWADLEPIFQKLYETRHSWIILWPKPWLICRWCANSSTATHWLPSIMAWTPAVFSSIVNVDGRLDHFSSVVVFEPGYPFVHTLLQ